MLAAQTNIMAVLSLLGGVDGRFRIGGEVLLDEGLGN